MSKVSVNGSVEAKTSGPDFFYACQPDGTPWPSVSAAHNGTDAAYRGIGKMRFVSDGNGGFDVYVYKGGVLLSNLKLQTVKVASNGHVTTTETVNGLQADITNFSGEFDGSIKINGSVLLKDTANNNFFALSITNGAIVLTQQ